MENEEIQKGFFKRIWYSITKIEKYPNMASEGAKKAFSYFLKIILIFSIIFSIGLIYKTQTYVKKTVEFLQKDFPDFSYENNILNLKNDTQTKEYESELGKIIIDTNDKTEQETNQYINSIESGIIVLKDKVVFKNIALEGQVNYKYEELSNATGIKQFNKEQIINYANSTQMLKLYISLFLTIVIYSFALYFISTLMYVFMISIFGYLTSTLTKIKMKYVAIFNMSVYAMTLSMLLELIYVMINLFVPFEITFFQIAYVSIACIYLVSAIFIIKSDFVKKQLELTKILEVQEQVKQELEKEKEKEEENQKPEERKNEEEKDKEKKDKDKEEPEGSGA